MSSDIINVKDYGAIGNNSHDDRPNIQDAFDAAFGPANAPHGTTNRWQNRPVYFPAGHYSIQGPLYLTNVVGGWIFGEAKESVSIAYDGSESGNTVIANGKTPIFMINGMVDSRIERMTFGSSPGTTKVGLYFYQDGTQGITGRNTLIDLFCQSGGIGILAGLDATGGCGDTMLIQCQFNDCPQSGLRLEGTGATNWSIYGGGGGGCSASSTGPDGDSGALYSCVAGGMSSIIGISVSINGYDIINKGGNPMSIIGGSSESSKCVFVRGTPVHMSGIMLRPDHSLDVVFVDSAGGGAIVMTGCSYAPNNLNGAGTIINLADSDVVIMDSCTSLVGGSTSVISGATGNKVYTRGCIFSNADTFTTYLANGGVRVDAG